MCVCVYVHVVYTLWKYPDMLCKIVLDLPAISRLKNGAGKQYRVVALQNRALFIVHSTKP